MENQKYMDHDKFVTQTAPKSNFIYCLVLALLFAALFVVAFFLLPQIGTYLFLAGALLCVGCIGTGMMLSASPAVTLRFEDDELYISDSNGKEHNIYAVAAGDFVFMQTPLEKKYDIGCLRIKHTAFWMFGVKNFSDTKRYVNDHFPHW